MNEIIWCGILFSAFCGGVFVSFKCFCFMIGSFAVLFLSALGYSIWFQTVVFIGVSAILFIVLKIRSIIKLRIRRLKTIDKSQISSEGIVIKKLDCVYLIKIGLDIHKAVSLNQNNIPIGSIAAIKGSVDDKLLIEKLK